MNTTIESKQETKTVYCVMSPYGDVMELCKDFITADSEVKNYNERYCVDNEHMSFYIKEQIVK